VGIDGAFWNAIQIRPMLLAMPQIVLLRRTSAADEKKTD